VVHAFTCTWHGPFLETVSKAVESKVVPVVLFFVALAWIARSDGRLALRAWFAAAVGIGAAMLLADLLWATLERPRPQEQFSVVLRDEAELATCAARPDALALRSGGSSSPSFPSRHALTAGVFATALWLARRRLGVLAALYGLAVCAQRLHSGKHWPSDLLAGLVLGAALAWLSWRLYPPFARRVGLPGPPEPDPEGAVAAEPGAHRLPG
jgi:membrane-associated phospholipid phosphatase